MPISNPDDWERIQEVNQDPYSRACVDVARAAMEILDRGEPFDPHDLISQADRESGAGGITGFMAGAAASMISQCHSRGDEFRRAWNKDVQSGGVLNPALLNVSKT